MCQFDGNLRWKSKPKPVHYAFIHGNHYIFKWYFPGLLSFIFGRFFYVCFGECTCHYDHLLGFWWLCRLFLDVDTSFFLFCLNIFSLRRRKKKQKNLWNGPFWNHFQATLPHFRSTTNVTQMIFLTSPNDAQLRQKGQLHSHFSS